MELRVVEMEGADGEVGEGEWVAGTGERGSIEVVRELMVLLLLVLDLLMVLLLVELILQDFTKLIVLNYNNILVSQLARVLSQVIFSIPAWYMVVKCAAIYTTNYQTNIE